MAYHIPIDYGNRIVPRQYRIQSVEDKNVDFPKKKESVSSWSITDLPTVERNLVLQFVATPTVKRYNKTQVFRLSDVLSSLIA
jgi:hypothetical protein